MPHHSYPWSAEFMSSWVEEKTGVRVGEIKRTSFLHSRRVRSDPSCWFDGVLREV